MVPTIKIIDKRLARRVKVAAYCRVSTSDADQLASLDNQKKHYEKFIKANPDWEFAGVYSDDGISGRSADKRKAFQQMLSDIEMGYIYAVMVKDLSRLGRDYVSVGNYTDVYFPDHDIRFIAVNDGIDSEEGEKRNCSFQEHS